MSALHVDFVTAALAAEGALFAAIDLCDGASHSTVVFADSTMDARALARV
jgi:hypothetical protein